MPKVDRRRNEKQRKAAKLLAHTEMAWEDIWPAAGYKHDPGADNKQILELVEEEKRLTSFDEHSVDMDWEELAERAKADLSKIAAGLIQPKTAQVAALKEILNRGEGRVVEKKKEEEEDPAVVILPTIGTRENMWICPQCRKDYSEDRAWEVYIWIVKQMRQESSQWREIEEMIRMSSTGVEYVGISND